jgi:phosphonate degradation associated HDIG domain protein
MALNSEDILALYQQYAAQQYGGEAVSQMEHALQCAHLAERAGESDAVVLAALLHDIGHLLAAQQHAQGKVPSDKDDLHQFVALPFLRATLPESVLAPIAMHVDAKRYLVATEPSYGPQLSPASQRSLALQGGPFSAAQADAFLALPHAAEAVRLRRYDDLAKVPAAVTPDLAHYAGLLRTVAAEFASGRTQA